MPEPIMDLVKKGETAGVNGQNSLVHAVGSSGSAAWIGVVPPDVTIPLGKMQVSRTAGSAAWLRLQRAAACGQQRAGAVDPAHRSA